MGLRNRIVVACAALLASLALPGVGSASELSDRRDGVHREIVQAERHLDQSSADLSHADRRLARAESSLQASRAALAQARTDLAAAEALDRRVRAELARAVDDLARARVARAEGEASFRRQQAALRAVVVDQYAAGGPDVMALRSVLNTQDPAELTNQLSSRSAVLDVQAGALARLTASETLLAVQESALRDAKREVAARRAEAAANLARTAELVSAAARAAEQVESLVAQRSQARESAADAHTEDLRQLEQLEAERAEIAELLRRQAAKARAEAEARAAAAAAAAAADDGSDESDAGPEAAGTDTPPAPTSAALSYPVAGPITSPYGMRFHPIYHVWKLHDGTDFGAACGTPVHAAESGTVIATYYGGGYGNRVVIDHGLRGGVGLGTTYNHLSGYATSPGAYVERGQVIGYVGTTGASTGCHLHFMVFEDGATVDPMTWLS